MGRGWVLLTVGALLNTAPWGVQAHRALEVLRHAVVVGAGADPPAAPRGRAAHCSRISLPKNQLENYDS
jgi:hypothetical protein